MKKNELNPNWDVMLQSVNSAIDNTFQEYKALRKKEIDCYGYSNGRFCIISDMEKLCNEISETNKRLVELIDRRNSIINHELSEEITDADSR